MFSKVSNTGNNSNGRRYKAPEIFHRGLDYWEPDGTIAVASSQDFYHRDFERKISTRACLFFRLQSHAVTCSMKESEHLFLYSRIYVQFVHDVITKILLSALDKPMRLAL